MMHEVVNAHRKTCAINTHRKRRAPFDKRYQLVKRRYSVQACFPRRIPHSFLLDRGIGAALRCSVSSLALLALLEVEAASSALLVVTAETPEPAAGATTETTLRTGGTTETTEPAAGFFPVSIERSFSSSLICDERTSRSCFWSVRTVFLAFSSSSSALSSALAAPRRAFCFS